MALKMRQSIAQLEEAFVEEAYADRERQEALRRRAVRRSRTRRLERKHSRGRWRFFGLVLALLATAAGVTVAMFQILILVLG
jgi:anti-sigma-K factor RskA